MSASSSRSVCVARDSPSVAACNVAAAAEEVAADVEVVSHRRVALDLGAFGGSALTDTALEVPKTAESSGIPITYVPARNKVFLSVALGLGEVIGARDLFFGANAVDYSGYPDCRPEFVSAFEALANVATKAGVEGDRFRVQAPLIADTKARIIARGRELGVDLSRTFSCYDPVDGAHCGVCDSCRLRRRGFREAGGVDPTRYAREEPEL